MVKTEIADFIFLWRTPDHLIVVVTRNERICYLEIADRWHESDSRSTASIKRIELSNGTSVHFHIAAMHIERMLQCIGNLAIVYLNLGRINEDAIALTIMNCSILHQEFLPGHIAGINKDTMIGTMNISIVDDIIIRRCHQMDTLPLSRSAVVRQIIKHIVDSISSHHHLLALFTLNMEGSIHLQPGILMKIQSGASPNSKRSQTVHLHSAVYHNRLAIPNGRILTDGGIVQQSGIPRISFQIHLLQHSTLQLEEQIIFHQLRIILILLAGSQFHEYTDTISLAHLYILSLEPSGLSQKRTVHIYTVSSLVAVFQSYRRTAQSLPRMIINPEASGWRRHIRESSVQANRIRGKSEQVVTG